MAKILQLKIELDGIKPPVWRTILIEDSSSLQELHKAIQKAMGWGDYHMWEFRVGNETIAPEEEGYNAAEAAIGRLKKSSTFKKIIEQDDAKGKAPLDKLNELLEEERQKGKNRFTSDTEVGNLLNSPNQKLAYLYDFGDNWEHIITVENVLEEDQSQTYPACIAGARACPPEDCGGVNGYHELISIRKNKSHPEYKERISEWLGEDYDPERFDIDETNQTLRLPSDTEVENAASAFTEEYFPEIWKDEKDNLRELSKRELAEKMYYLGVLHFMMDTTKRLPEMIKETKK